MGLDMYLTRKSYTKNWSDNDPQWKVIVTKDGKPTSIDSKRVSSVEEDIGYWRKANSIHAWFVKNVQDGNDDCGTYYVPEKKLEELLDTCQKVLDDPDLGPQLLPTANGFFFGDISYGDYYLDDLRHTVDVLTLALEILDQDKSGSFYYHSSW